MRASSCGFLYSITGPCRNRMPPSVSPPRRTARGSADVKLQRGARASRDLFHGPGGVHPDQDALVGVEVDQRRRLALVHLKPVPDDLFLIVVTLEELAPAV